MDFFSVLGLIGGLVFFLYGMHIMSESLEKMAGGKLEVLLKKATANPIVSVLLGAAITIAMQSSSASTVMLVGLVNSGLMNFAQTVYVIYGANVGTTLTAWILSLSGIDGSNFFLQMLKPINFSPILALIGIGLLMLSKSNRRRTVGTVFIGFALLMYGMEMMGDAVAPLAEMEGYETLLGYFQNPLVGLLVAMLFTAVIQSSAGAIGILQALSLTGGMTYSMVIPMVMGLNIGTCITSMLAALGTNTNAKRVAGIHVAANLVGTVVFLPLYLLLNAIFQFPFANVEASPWSIALVHSLFNILLTLLLMPFTNLLVKLVTVVLKDKSGKDAEGDEEPEFMLSELLLRSPSVAIAECSAQTVKMCTLAHDTIFETFETLYSYDEDRAEKILKKESRLDRMEDVLGTYLVPIGSQALSAEDSRLVASMLQNIGDFERLGDHAVNLLKVSEEMYRKNISFSEQAKVELAVLMNATVEILNLTEQAFRERNLALAARVEPLEQVIDNLISQIRTSHINRLCAGDCTIELGFVLADLLTNFERISDHCSNIAVALIEITHDCFDTHRYLNDIKTGNNEEFTRIYGEYVERFAI